MKFNEFLINYKNQKKFPHALLLKCSGCIDYDYLIKNYLKTLTCATNLFCDNCKSCIKINHHSYVDLIVVDCSSNILTKEDVLRIQNTFSGNAIEINNIKLYVIINIENANKVALNSLLKFLEEPPINTYALFFCRNEEAVLNTIRSRCQKLIVTNENNIDDEFVNECFDSIHQYEKFINEYDINQEQKFIQNLIKNPDIITQNTFIKKIKEADQASLQIILNMISYYTTIEKRLAIKQLKKYLHLNLSKILLANKILMILE